MFEDAGDHEAGEAEEVEAFEGGVDPFIVPCESAESGGPGEASLDDPAAWQQHEASLGQRVFDHFELDAVALSGFGGVRSGVALIDVGHLDRSSGDGLHLLGQGLDLGAVALIGWSNPQRQQVPQGIDRDVDLGALAPFGSVLSGAGPTLGSRLQSPAIDADCGRLALAPGKLAQQNAGVFDQPLETSGPHLALHLLINRWPRRIIVRHETPLVAGPGNVANPVEHRPQIVLSMSAVLPAQQQIRQHKCPFLIGNIARIPNLALRPHPSMLDRKQPPAKSLTRCKLHNSL